MIHCNDINTEWIESALQNWTYSSSSFYRGAAWSIVGYDQNRDKVIIFGGIGSDEDFQTADWYQLYIYDLITDKLTHVPISWSVGAYGDDEIEDDTYDYTLLINSDLANAIIINSTMYFLIQHNMLTLDLNPIYSYYIDNIGDIAPQVKPNIFFDSDSPYYGGMGCMVTDSSRQYLFVTNMICNRDIIVINLRNHAYWFAAQSNEIHFEGACVVMNDILYVIDGHFSNRTEYIDLRTLLNPQLSPYDPILMMFYYPALRPRNPRTLTEQALNVNEQIIDEGKYYTGTGYGVITDSQGKNIYLLGGYDHSQGIYRLDVTQQTFQLLDIHLPSTFQLKYATTILHQKTGRIYAFRGVQGADSEHIAFTTNSLISSDSKPITTTIESTDNIEPIYIKQKSESVLSTTMEFVIGIIIIGLICIVGIICIGIFAINRIQKSSSNPKNVESDSKVECLMDNEHNDDDIEMEKMTVLDNEGNKDLKMGNMNSNVGSISNESSTPSLSDTKMHELYKLYSKSKLDCLNECDSLQLNEEVMDQLFCAFERFKAFEHTTK